MIKLALIGCGKWGKNYLKTVSAIEGCEFKWACDLDYQKLNQAAHVQNQFDLSGSQSRCSS